LANDAASSAEDGFTLLEAVVAFTLTAGVLVGLCEVLSRDMAGLGSSEDYGRAVALAEARLETLGVAEPLVRGTTSGRFDERFAWQVEVTPGQDVTPVGASRPALRLDRLRVTVSWQGGKQPRSVSLESLRLEKAN
jgi:general secretion pathway protein I